MLDTTLSGSTITTLDVNNLTSNISAPAIAGIGFFGNGSVTLNVDLPPWQIISPGNGISGVTAGNLTADPVTVSVVGTIQTNGIAAPGIYVFTQGGSATVRSVADITTNGQDSYGIFAVTDPGDIDVRSASAITTSGLHASGIFASSNGGNITIDAAGILFVGGIDAFGIFAESFSGTVNIRSAGEIFMSSPTSVTGGAAIFAHTTATAEVESWSNIHTVADDVAGIAAEGDAGASVTSRGSIFTEGDRAPAIIVQSATGDGTVLSAGDIRTQGTDSPGIEVEAAGTVLVRSWGNVSATGLGSPGITATSTGANAQVDNYGSVIGGPCCGGVMLGAATTALVRNYGTIIGNGAGEAIYAAANAVLVENFGTVTGDVILFGSTASFNNHAGALFNSGDTVMASLVTNDGTIAPGGRGAILPSPTFMSDDFVQNAGGIYAVDLDPAAGIDRNDYLVASDTASVAGKVEVSVLSVPLTAAETFTILTGTGGVTDNGLGLIASPALHATLTVDATNVYLGIAVDYVVDGLNPNQRGMTTDLSRIFNAGAGGVTPVLLGLLNVDDLASYKSALNQLSPEIYSNAEIAALYSSLAFSNSLLSCKVNGTDTASIIREGQCLWAGASARFSNTSTTSDQIGSNETAGLFTAGAQVALDDVWRLGVAGGFQSSSLQTATGASSDGSLGQAGIALKYNPGPLLLAAAVSGGGATYDTRRIMSFGGFTGVAESDQTLGILSGALRAAYVLGSPHLYAKPMLDVSVTQLQLGSFTETGSAAALAVEGGGQTVFALTPTVEVGTEFWLANGTLIRPLIRLGGVFYSGNDLALTAGFADLAPLSAIPGGSGFTITTDMDNAMGLVGAGLDVINGNDAVLRLSYDGQLGETTQIHSVGIKGSARF